MTRSEARAIIASLAVEDCRVINQFRDDHGSQWRNKLRELWDSGRDTDALRRVRNALGPSGINHWGKC